MLKFFKIFILTGTIFGVAQAGKIAPKAETKDLVQASSQDTKIYGGRDTHIHEAPYQAFFQGCSGAIISPTFIITAAHCLPRRRFWDYKYYVRVGSANRTTGGQLIQTKKFIPHPNYNPSDNDLLINLSYDVALIELKSRIKFNKNASAIELAKKEVPVGELVMISGWGLNTTNLTSKNPYPEYLQSIQVPIIDRETCRKLIRKWNLDAPELTDKMICNYKVGEETCQGDSGGPVVFNKTLVGVVSWGYPLCSVGPGINLNVAHIEIQNFIKDNLDIGKAIEEAKITDPLGEDKDTKIFGGRDTHIHEAPYIASFQDNFGNHICGGAIISETMILTAAHCFKKVEKLCRNNFVVRVGSSNRTSGGQLVPVEQCVSHPDYNKINYDVGVIKLQSRIKLNENVKIIEVAKNHIPIGGKVMISGWGYFSPDNRTKPEYLQSIVVPIIDNEKCEKMVKNKTITSRVTDNMICNYEEGKETCQGDSGGPLVYDNTVIGVVSWGPSNECGVHPGVNAYLMHCEIRAFIEEQLGLVTKIIGGRNTKISEVPWTAALEHILYPGQFCGGTIISERMILTAAHCFKDIGIGTKDLKVRVGTSCRMFGGQLIEAEKITKHPKFNEKVSADYDVAIIELKNDIKLSSGNAAVIKLANEEPATGVNATIAGWGRTNIEDNSQPNILQSVVVPILDWEQCKQRISEQSSKDPRIIWEVTKRMICGHLKGHNACYGDSGGPVTIGDNQVVGIVSWSSSLTCAKGPTVYTNVANCEIRSFIRDVTGI